MVAIIHLGGYVSLTTMDAFLDAKSRTRLAALCKQGRLFDAQRFIDEKGTCCFRKTHHWTPLFIAVDRGFHSLVEVLLRYEHAQWDLEKAYRGALRRRRNDLAGMILRAPSWNSEIDPVEALATGDPVLVAALARADTDFTGASVVALGALANAPGTINCLKAAGIPLESVADQLVSAMVTHAVRGHIKSVFHLLKAGMDPRREGECYSDKGQPEEKCTTMEAAAISGRPKLMKMLRPSVDKDDPERLQSAAVNIQDHTMLEVLLDAGFPINCQKNGGSTALHHILREGYFFKILPTPSWPRSEYWERYVSELKWLLERGAQWVGRDARDYREIRDSLCGFTLEEAATVMGMVIDAGAIRNAELKETLRTARMKPLEMEMKKRATCER